MEWDAALGNKIKARRTKERRKIKSHLFDPFRE